MIPNSALNEPPSRRRQSAERTGWTVRRLTAAAGALALAAVVSGCAGYRVGSGTLYDPAVRTVYVPMIESNSFRRDLGERLTEAVVKEIELKTPYKVVADPGADSVLEIRFRSDTRNTLAEDEFDNPRVFDNLVRADVRWVNRRRLPLAPVQTFGVPGGLISGAVPAIGVGQTTPLIPESGQTVASQQQLAITRLAEQIVGTLETPW